MVMTRPPSRSAACRAVPLLAPPLMPGSTSGLLPGDPPEHAADGHPDARQISLPENVAGHDLAGDEDPLHPAHRRPLIHPHSQIREGDPRPQRIREKRWPVDSLGPMRLGRREALGPAIVQLRRIEPSLHYRAIE